MVCAQCFLSFLLSSSLYLLIQAHRCCPTAQMAWFLEKKREFYQNCHLNQIKQSLWSKEDLFLCTWAASLKEALYKPSIKLDAAPFVFWYLLMNQVKRSTHLLLNLVKKLKSSWAIQLENSANRLKCYETTSTSNKWISLSDSPERTANSIKEV